jgi:hypothetical protein
MPKGSMKRHTKIIGVAATVLMVCLIITAGFIVYRVEHPRIKRTIDNEAAWQYRHLCERFSAVFPTDNGVCFVDSWFPNQNTNVSVGYSFEEPGDDGNFRTYTVTRIEEDGVLINYLSHFDHRTFGKWLIEEDTGTVKLKWKKPQ